MSGENNVSQDSKSTDWKIQAEESVKKWNTIYYLWKKFEESQVDLIKSYIGLALYHKPDGDETSNVNIDFTTLHSKYDEDKRNVIDKIFRQLEFNISQLRLSHTLLYVHLSKHDGHVCIFRQMRPGGGINFIDSDGRVYSSWEDFIKTNKLPGCDYMAPKNGIHNVATNEIELHKSPASSKVGKICDVVATGATVTAVGLSVVAAAPALALGLGVGGMAYSVRRSWRSLVDRKKHKQSLAPSNLETVNCYMDIGSTAVCGVSAVNLLNSSNILKLTSKCSAVAATAVKGVHYIAAENTSVNFGIHLLKIEQKLRDGGEFSSFDFVDLSIDMFLIYGTVSNVRQMQNYFSSLEVDSARSKGLSKRARKRWRKSQAKIMSAGDSFDNQNVTEVSSWDPEMFNFLIGTSDEIFSYLLHQHCSILHEIYINVCRIIEDFRNFHLHKVHPGVFCNTLLIHCQNLFKLLKNNNQEIMDPVQEILNHSGIIVSSELISEISNIINDGVIAINNVNEEISLDDIVYESKPSSGEVFYEMILGIVKHRIYQKEIYSTEKLLSLFAKELSSVTKELQSKIVQQYEDIVSFNIRSIGEENTKMVLSRIGINTKNDFANKVIERIIENLKISETVDVLFVLETQLNELCLLYRELFLKIADENDITSINVLETCEILHNSVDAVIQHLTKIYEESREIYEINAKYIGHKEAMISAFGELSLDNLSSNSENFDELIFKAAVKQLNLLDIIPQLHSNHIEENTTEHINESVNLTDDFEMEALLRLCSFYAENVDSHDLTKIYSFVTDKFIAYFLSVVNQQNIISDLTEKLKWNINILGKRDFNRMRRFLYEANNLKILNKAIELFKKEDFVNELIAEYHQKMDNVSNFNVECLKNLIADDGVIIHMMKFENRSHDIEEFKCQASNLFDMNIHHINGIQTPENLIVLKNSNKYVLFQFVQNEIKALVMQIDLSKTNE